MDDEITCEVEGSKQGVKELQLLSGRRTNRSRDRQPSDCICRRYVRGHFAGRRALSPVPVLAREKRLGIHALLWPCE